MKEVGDIEYGNDAVSAKESEEPWQQGGKKMKDGREIERYEY